MNETVFLLKGFKSLTVMVVIMVMVVVIIWTVPLLHNILSIRIQRIY